MAQFLFFCFILVAHVSMSIAMEPESSQTVQTVVEPKWSSVSEPPMASASTSRELEIESAEAPGIRRLGKHHHIDKSIAGGGVILGGLAAAILAAVFCYIRVTRRRDEDNKS